MNLAGCDEVKATEVYLTTLTYDEFGARRRAALGNGATTTWTYEPDTQRLKHVDTTSQGRTLQALTYTYDLVGNVKTLTNALGEATGRRSGAVSYTYDYDDLYRLTSATGTALSRPGVVDRFKTTYTFGDEIHNMTRLEQRHWLSNASDPDQETAHPPHTNHDFDYAYGRAGPHQATKIGDRNLVYDANGNTLRECRDHGDATCKANSDKLRRYFWGEENELLAVIDGGGWNTTRFIYDAGGQRVVKLGRGGESITIGQFFALKGRKAATKHVFVGETRVASKLLPSPGWEPSWSEGTAVSGPILTATAGETVSGCDPSSYQPQKCPIDPAANPVIDRRPDTTKIKPATYYYHSDHIGSTSWVTDQNGRVHEHVEYFPYGEVWRDARYDSDGDPVHRQQFLFSAKEMDEETGLYYFGARYLDPVRARWASTDPADRLNAEEGPRPLNLYQATLWNPLRIVDPDGRHDRALPENSCLRHDPPRPKREQPAWMKPPPDPKAREVSEQARAARAALPDAPYIPAPQSLMGTRYYYQFRWEAAPESYKNDKGPEYLIEFGYKNIQKFEQLAAGDASGPLKAFVANTALELQQGLENALRDDPSIATNRERMLDVGYKSHASAYERGGFETLTIWDQIRVGATPDLGDLANTHAVPVYFRSLHMVNGLTWWY